MVSTIATQDVGPAAAPVASQHENQLFRQFLWGAIGAIAVGFAVIILYTLDDWKPSPTALGVGVMWATAMAAAGGLLGLLFGIPRALRSKADARNENYRANTNLEEVSDWLTKILVGASLTQVGTILGALRDVGSFLGPSLARESEKTNAGDAFAIGVTVTYFVGGFVLSYILTRSKLRSLLE